MPEFLKFFLTYLKAHGPAALCPKNTPLILKLVYNTAPDYHKTLIFGSIIKISHEGAGSKMKGRGRGVIYFI